MATLKKMTPEAALAEGYIYYNEEGEETLGKLADLVGLENKENVESLSERLIYFIVDKEPHYYNVSNSDVAESIKELTINQDQFGDEDGDLAGLVDEVLEERPDLFQVLTDALNEKFRTKKFLMPSDIVLEIPKVA